MAAEIAEGNAGPAGAPFEAQLSAACAAVADLAAAAGRISGVPDDDLSGVMGALTTLIGQLDGLRVAVTRRVRDRGLWRLRGAANVTGWLRADPRTADAAWLLSQLANRSAELPKVTGLLADGQVSLAQAGTVCWQISQLPDVPEPPGPADEQAALTSPGPGTEGEDELWAGLWRSGDVHAAADELFARFLPRLGTQELRLLGAHLREAADAQERAGEDYDVFARRSLRMSRSLGGTGELSGRLHPEAAEQVLAAFEELGGKAGPDDPRTKAQRWADVLVYLTGLAGLAGPVAEPARPGAVSDPAPDCEPDLKPARPGGAPSQAGPGASQHPASAGAAASHPPDPGPEPAPDPEPVRDLEPDAEPGDDQPSPDGGHGHDAPAGAHDGQPALGAGGIAPSGLRRPRVIVTVPLSTLLGNPLAPGAVLGAGTPITGEAARRLACDAEIVRMITSQAPDLPGQHVARSGFGATAELARLLAGAIEQLPRPLGGPSAVLDIGRKSQSWTPRQRDALYAQYGGRCGAAGCNRRIDVIHHIIHWLYGGKTKLANGAPFCLFHHWLVHEGGWRVVRQPDCALVMIPPPRGWRPGTIYRRGKPLPESGPGEAGPGEAGAGSDAA